MSYQDYLNSPKWQTIRTLILERDNYRCEICGLSAELVHHLSYTERTKEGLNCAMLFSLCNSCHYKCHFDHGEKLPIARAKAKTLKLVFGSTRPGKSNINIGLGMKKRILDNRTLNYEIEKLLST